MAALHITLEFVRVAAGGDPYAFDFRPQSYLLRSRGGGFVTAEFAWAPAFLADLEALRRAAHGVASPTAERERMLRVGQVLRGFLGPLGWAKLEADVAATVQDGGTVSLVIRSAAAELYAIPWELLVVDPLGQHLAALPRVRIAYVWPDVRVTPSAPVRAPGRVLVAWSAAAGQVPANDHAAAIARACQAAGVAFAWDDDVVANASLTALAARLDAAAATERPVAALHLLCHGIRTDAGVALALDGDQPGDDPAVVSAGHLAQLLGRHADRLRLVVLAACEGAVDGPAGTHLGSVAQAIHRSGVEAVIASRYALSIDGSTALCESLYPALLAESAALEDAIATARGALVLATQRIDWIAPQLYGQGDDAGLRPITLAPFSGLAPFTPERRRFFTGRSAEVERLIAAGDQLAASGAPRMIAVVGAPGVGKTSLVLAGLVPRHVRSVATPWLALTASADPFATLADAFARALGGPIDPTPEAVAAALARWQVGAPGAHVLVVVDPLADILAAAGARAPSLLRVLWRLAGAPAPRVTVVVTLRTAELSQWGHLAVDARLRLEQLAFDDRHRVLVDPLDEAGLRDAIVEPLRRVGLAADPGLVDRAVREAAELGAPLPLLQHTLALLWERRSGPLLTLAGYEAVGGVAGSLDRFAEAALERWDDARRALARRLLVRLVRVDPSGNVHRADGLRLDALPGFAAVVDELVRVGIVARRSDDTVVLAHEALISRWKRLAGWIDQDRRRLLDLGTLQQWAAEWQARGTLLDDTRLGYARMIAGENRDDLDPEVRDLLAASEAAAAAARRQAAAQEAALRRSLARARLAGRLAGVLAVAAVLALVAAVHDCRSAADDAREAQRAAERAARSEAAASASRDRTRDVVLLAAAELARRDPTTVAMLLREIDEPHLFPNWRHAAVDAIWQPISTSVFVHPAPVVAALWVPRKNAVLTAADDGRARLWRPGELAPRVTFVGHRDRLTAAAVDPQGELLATAARDGTARIWSTDGLALAELPVLVEPPGTVTHVAFTVDGEALVTADTAGRVRLWDYEAATSRVLVDHDGPVHALARAWDGSAIATAGADGTVRLAWDGAAVMTSCADPIARDPAPFGASCTFRDHANAVLAVGLGPDARVLLSASRDGTACLRDLTDGGAFALDGASVAISAAGLNPAGDLAATATADGRIHLWRIDDPTDVLATVEAEAGISVLAFSPDGRQLAAGAVDGELVVLRVDPVGPVRHYRGHTGPVTALRFSPSGDTLLSAAHDGTARLWRGPPPDAPVHLVGHADHVRDLALGADGTHALTGADDGGLRLWHLEGEALPDILEPHPAPITRVAFSPAGDKFVTAASDGSVRLWRGRHPDAYHALPDRSAAVTDAVFDPTGTRVVVATDAGAVSIHSVADARPPIELAGHTAAVVSARVSASGLHVVTASEDATARVWSSADPGDLVVILQHAAPVLAAEFSPSGRRVVTASADATAQLWTFEEQGPPRVLRGHTTAVRAAQFAPDENALLTAGADGTVRLWSLAGEHLDTLALDDRTPAVAATFSPDGRFLGALDESGRVQVWHLRRGGPPELFQLHAGATARRFLFHPGAARVLTAETHAVVLWTLTHDLDDEALRARLWQATSHCLPYRTRVDRLSEDRLDALLAVLTCAAHRLPPP